MATAGLRAGIWARPCCARPGPAARRRLGLRQARHGRDRAGAAPPGNFPVPLVQPKTDPGNWHFADIADVLQLAQPGEFLRLAAGHRHAAPLFEQPIVKDLTGGAARHRARDPAAGRGGPALADVGSLLNATGLFPDISKAISF